MAATYSRDRRRGSRAEARVFETVWRRYQREDTDLLEAGVAPATIDCDLEDVDRGTLRKILKRLANQGVLVRLDGANPENLRSRHSFAPAALYEGGEKR